MKFFGKSKSAGGAGSVGVTVDDGHIRLARVQWRGDGRPQVLALIERQRGADLVADLRRLRKDSQLMACRWLAVMGASDYQTFQIEAPDVPLPELAAASSWRVKDVLAQAMEQTVVDALLLPAASSSARSRQALVVAADRQVVAALAAPYSEAGITLAAVDIPELAQRNLAALCEDENRGLAFLYLGADSGLLTLTWHGELFACRRIEVGSRAWLDLSDPDGERQQAVFDRITLELQRTLDNFERQFSFISVNRMVLAGEAELLPLADYLKPNLYMPVALFEPAQVLDLPESVTTVPGALWPAIALALRAEEVAP